MSKEEQVKILIQKYTTNKLKSDEITEYIPLLLHSLGSPIHSHSQNEIVKMIVSTIGEYSKKQIIQNIYSIIPQMILFLNKHLISHPHHSSELFINNTNDVLNNNNNMNNMNNFNNLNNSIYMNNTNNYTLLNPLIPGSNISLQNIIYFSCGIAKMTACLLRNERLFTQPFIELLMTIMKTDCCHDEIVYETIVIVFSFIGKKLNLNRHFYHVLLEWLLHKKVNENECKKSMKENKENKDSKELKSSSDLKRRKSSFSLLSFDSKNEMKMTNKKDQNEWKIDTNTLNELIATIPIDIVKSCKEIIHQGIVFSKMKYM